MGQQKITTITTLRADDLIKAEQIFQSSQLSHGGVLRHSHSKLSFTPYNIAARLIISSAYF